MTNSDISDNTPAGDDTASSHAPSYSLEHLIKNVSESSSIAEAFWKRVSATPESVLYRYAVAPSASATRVWHSVTYSSAGAMVARIANYLASLGVSVGTPVAICSHTRPEWVLSDMAIQSLGAITVSIYQSLPWQEAGYILFDSQAQIVFAENEEQVLKLATLTNSNCPIPEREGMAATESVVSLKRVISFEPIEVAVTLGGDALLTSFTDILEDDSLSCQSPTVPSSLTRASTASIVYTSGTTGPPKGVVQSHGNHLSNVFQAYEGKVFPTDGTLMLYLPLAHSFARLAYYVGFLTPVGIVMPAVIDHKTSKIDLTSVARDIREGNATVVPSVPRLFEKMASALQAKTMGRGLQSWILRTCVDNARAVYEIKAAKQVPSMIHQIIFNGMSGIRSKIKQQLFGTDFSHGISGGAKLDPSVNRFFDALGILICEGYGLTETCVATHVNRLDRRKIGTVGPPFTGLEVRIAPEDGEIWMRGPNVAHGYWNRPQATAEAWTSDGWFKSGDIGAVDNEGFLTITDRKKELIVTAGGKKIPPQSIEGLFKSAPFISQPFLFGDEKPYCVMLFTLNDSELRAILTSRGIPVMATDILANLPIVREMLQEQIDRANLKVASHETIKKFAVVEEDFTIENGLLTPTLKVKRKKVVERYRTTIDSLYNSK